LDVLLFLSRVFSAALSVGGVVKAIRVPAAAAAKISNSRLKPPKGDIVAEAMAAGASGLAFARVVEGGALDGAKALKEGLTPEAVAAMIKACGAETVGYCHDDYCDYYDYKGGG
jgi:hypothetical protein